MAKKIDWWMFGVKDKLLCVLPNEEDNIRKAGETETEKQSAVNRWKEIKNYWFKINRVKHAVTGEENLHIIAYSNNEQYGYIITKLSELDTRIKKLSDYGIMMHQLCWDGFCRIVREHYRDINVEKKEYIDVPIFDEILIEFVKMYAEYISEKNIEPVKIKDGTKYYDIPQEDFKKVYVDSDFDYYGLTIWRKALRMQKYTKCNNNRTDFNANEENEDKKKVKVIRFYAEKIEALMENK